jgi:2-polyprenyl-6-methoxyphenol hydroxylase-like FAD-dependent oxidoreductase
VGLVAASSLARLGVDVRIIDLLASPNTFSRAAVIHARSLEMLDSMGTVEPFLDEGRRLRSVEMRCGDKRLASIDLSEVPSRYPFDLGLSQDRSEALLTAHLTDVGGSIERGVRLTDLRQHADAVDVVLEHPDGRVEETTVSWVIGCDGGHSVVRALAPTKLKGSFKGARLLLADCDVQTDLDRGVLTMFLGHEGLSGVAPLPGLRVRFFFSVDEIPAGGDPSLDQVQAVVDKRIGRGTKLTAPHWLTWFEVHHGQVPRYRFGRVFLAGDAAHIHSPAGGQGMNTGIQDAFNLAWKLALVCRGRASDALLDSYDAERHPVGASVVKFTSATTRLATLKNPLAVDARNVLLGRISARPSTAAKVSESLAESAISYETSPVVGEDVAGSRTAKQLISPGRHAPDVDALRDRLRADVHTVLLFAGSDPTAEPEDLIRLAKELRSVSDLVDVVTIVDDAATAADVPDAVLDVDGMAADAYLGGSGVGSLVVVRPDGYVGYVATPSDPEALRHYLQDILDFS